jgi:hypothetical protein
MLETNRIITQYIRKMLRKKLRKYESTICDMTTQERKELWEWVKSGNEVCENPWCISCENGRPMDYIQALRFHNDMAEEMAHFQWTEQEYSQDNGIPF